MEKQKVSLKQIIQEAYELLPKEGYVSVQIDVRRCIHDAEPSIVIGAYIENKGWIVYESRLPDFLRKLKDAIDNPIEKEPVNIEDLTDEELPF